MVLVPWAALLVFGTIMVSSASVAMPGNFIEKQFINLAISAFLVTLILTVPLSLWARFYWLGWLVSLVLVLAVLVPGLGHEAKGATRWIRLGGFNLQAVEVAKFGLMIYLAGYLSRYHERLQTSPTGSFFPWAWCSLFVP
jgi:cell division protein FtsW